MKTALCPSCEQLKHSAAMSKDGSCDECGGRLPAVIDMQRPACFTRNDGSPVEFFDKYPHVDVAIFRQGDVARAFHRDGTFRDMHSGDVESYLRQRIREGKRCCVCDPADEDHQ